MNALKPHILQIGDKWECLDVFLANPHDIKSACNFQFLMNTLKPHIFTNWWQMGDNTQRPQFILEVSAKGNRVGDPAAPVILNPPPQKKNKVTICGQ